MLASNTGSIYPHRIKDFYADAYFSSFNGKPLRYCIFCSDPIIFRLFELVNIPHNIFFWQRKVMRKAAAYNMLFVDGKSTINKHSVEGY